MEHTKNWYVVYTKPRHEKKVADLLKKKKLKSYFPRYNQVEEWQDKRRIVNVPLFSSIVFVYAMEQDHLTIKQVDGVSNLLYWLHKPAVIKPQEISSIRYFIEQNINIQIEKIQIQDSHDSDGSYTSIINLINTQNKVFLPSLGYILVAEAIQDEKIRIVA